MLPAVHTLEASISSKEGRLGFATSRMSISDAQALKASKAKIVEQGTNWDQMLKDCETAGFLKYGGGLAVCHVVPDGPAWLAGIREWDLIVKVNDSDVRLTSAAEVAGHIATNKDSLTLTVLKSSRPPAGPVDKPPPPPAKRKRSLFSCMLAPTHSSPAKCPAVPAQATAMPPPAPAAPSNSKAEIGFSSPGKPVQPSTSPTTKQPSPGATRRLDAPPPSADPARPAFGATSASNRENRKGVASPAVSNIKRALPDGLTAAPEDPASPPMRGGQPVRDTPAAPVPPWMMQKQQQKLATTQEASAPGLVYSFYDTPRPLKPGGAFAC